MERPRRHVFISYAHKDQAYVSELADFLEREGLSVWYDRDIPTGQRWDTEIKWHLDTAGAVVVVSSKAAVGESIWVDTEVDYANRKHRPIYPLALDGAWWLPRLESIDHQRVSGQEMPPAAWVEKVREGVRRGHRAWVRLPHEPKRRRSLAWLRTEFLLVVGAVFAGVSTVAATRIGTKVIMTSPSIAIPLVAAAFVLVVLVAMLWRRLVWRWSVLRAREVRPRTDFDVRARKAIQRNVERLARAVRERESTNLADVLAVAGRDNETANVVFREVGPGSSGRVGTLSAVREFLAGLVTPRLVIVGPPGSGKTVLATELMLAYVRSIARDLPRSEDLPVPVRLNLADWEHPESARDDLVTFVVRQLRREYAVPLHEAVELVNTGHVMPVLDGLDEMDRLNPADGQPATYVRASAAIEKINSYLEKRPGAPVVVTCRDPMYDDLLTRHVNQAVVVRIDPLVAEDVVAFIGRKLEQHTALFERWAPVTAELTRNSHGAAHAVLRSPWVLTLALAATGLRQGFDPLRLLGRDVAAEDLKGELLASFAKAVYERAEERSRVDSEYAMFPVADARTLEHWLRRLARYLADEGGAALWSQESVSRIEVTLHTLWPIAGRMRTRALHLAGHLLLVTVFLIPCYLAALGGVGHGPTTLTALMNGDIRSDALTTVRLGWLAGISAVAYTWATWLGVTRHPHRSQTKSYAFRSTAMRKLSLGWRVIAGTEIALAIGFGFGVLAIFFAGPVAGTIVGAVIGMLLGVAMARIGLDRGLTGGYDKGIGWRNELGLGLLLGGAGALAFPLLAGYPWWAGASILGVLGFSGAFFLSMQAWLRYVIAMSVMRIRHQLPWRLGAFLYWAHGAGLFRISGVGYQYRHAELQDWFATSAYTEQPATSAGSATASR